VFLLFFYFVAALYEKYKPRLGHATCFTVILGIAWSIAFYWYTADSPNLAEIQLSYSFKSNIFFQVILPPIVFNSGFSMKRKKFFENFGNIMIFGLVVTFVCFFLYSVASFIVLDFGF
jgi:NhaP-type Na+/H+ or K+/H+ antiporter